jgi:hypothetical protein
MDGKLRREGKGRANLGHPKNLDLSPKKTKKKPLLCFKISAVFYKLIKFFLDTPDYFAPENMGSLKL